MGPYLLGVLSPETAATNDHQIRSPICAAIYNRQISAVLDNRQHKAQLRQKIKVMGCMGNW
jgi:hypothetical protein